MQTILLVEDKESFREMLIRTLEGEGYELVTAPSAEEAVTQLGRRRFDVVVTDLKLPRGDGLGVLRAAHAADPLVPVILMTAYGTIETAVQAIKSGAYDFITKPFDTEELLLLIRRGLEWTRLQTENLLLREQLGAGGEGPTIVGQSPQMKDLMRQIGRIAASNATVLLLGESGTGKELFARAIHHTSPRRNAPFVAINCAAIPETLVESELFGHERGAFTGADSRRPGKFELANRGSVLLDEVGDLPPGLQAKLLRVLQERTFERVGGTRTLEVDIRILAASNRDLKDCVRRGTFREDLYYRLCVFPITIPPLRSRKEDIIPLAEHFLAFHARRLSRPILELSEKSRQRLLEYAWPGNIRELENCIERAAILAAGRLIEPEQLGLGGDGEMAGLEGLPAPPGTLSELVAKTVREVETRAIRRALAVAQGNRAQAARTLGVNYKTLLNKLREYGLS